MVEAKSTSILTFYAQYVRRKKTNILFGSVLTTLLIIFIQSGSRLKFIRNNLLTEQAQHFSIDIHQSKLFEPNFLMEVFAF